MEILTPSIADVPQRVDLNPLELDVPFVAMKMNQAEIIYIF